MNVLFRNPLSVTASALIAALSIGSAFGRASKVVGEKPVFDDLPSPSFPGRAKPFKLKDWLEIKDNIKVSLAPEPKMKTCRSSRSNGASP